MHSRRVSAPMKIPWWIAVLAAAPVIFGIWSVTLAARVASLRQQVEACVRLTGLLGTVDQAASRLRIAIETAPASGAGRPVAERLRQDLVSAGRAVAVNDLAQDVVPAQMTAIARAVGNMERSGAVDGKSARDLAAAVDRIADSSRAATGIVRTKLSALSVSLGSLWTRMYGVAISAAVLGVALSGLLVVYERSLREVRQLRGILPMCSYCKRVRNDKDYWEQVESYVSNRSAAEFSHGVCPDCYENVARDFLGR